MANHIRLYPRSPLTENFVECVPRLNNIRYAYTNWVEEDWFSNGANTTLRPCEKVDVCKRNGQDNPSCLQSIPSARFRGDWIWPATYPHEPQNIGIFRLSRIHRSNRRRDSCAKIENKTVCARGGNPGGIVTGCATCYPKLQASYSVSFQGVNGVMTARDPYDRPLRNVYSMSGESLLTISPILGTTKLKFTNAGGSSGESYLKIKVAFSAFQNQQITGTLRFIKILGINRMRTYPFDIARATPIKTKLRVSALLNKANVIITQSDIDATKTPDAFRTRRWNDWQYSIPIYVVTKDVSASWSSDLDAYLFFSYTCATEDGKRTLDLSRIGSQYDLDGYTRVIIQSNVDGQGMFS